MSSEKIWRPPYNVNKEIEAFTVGKDYLLDMDLVVWDCLGSMAHGTMLQSIGVLSPEDLLAIKGELAVIMEDAGQGQFTITVENEDVHAAVEARLIEKLGDPGKKIHAARSRNDQVLVDLRLYGKANLLTMERDLLQLCRTLAQLAQTHEYTPMVGRTHTQLAMPSSVGLWAGSFLESLLDDWKLLRGAYDLLDQCPLGSAASYGVPLDIDRELTASLLGFRKVQNNVLYVNNSRGKMGSIALSACVQITQDLAKLSQELILLSMPEFGYFEIPQELCTGSSIMPQKKNPCALELVRAKSATVLSCLFRILEIVRTLPTGYNRDGQETKEPFMEGIALTLGCIRVLELTVRKLKVNEEKLLAGFHPEVFATDRALELVASGMPFREAYEKVKHSLDELGDMDPKESLRQRTHIGASGNLDLKAANASIEKSEKDRQKRHEFFHSALSSLLKDTPHLNPL